MAQTSEQIYRAAATLIQMTSAFGPGFYGTLHDRFGDYAPVLGPVVIIELVTVTVISPGSHPDYSLIVTGEWNANLLMSTK
jgi:hypothetical protein